VVEVINEGQASSVGEAQFKQTLGGSKVSLTLRRAGEATPVKVVLVEDEYDANQKPVVKRLDSGVGLIDLPAVTTGGDVFAQYATLVQQGIRDADQAGVCGWVVDTRRTNGGNMWPLVAGLGPVMGEGEQGAFVAPGRKIAWAYQGGQARSGLQGLARVETPYQLKQAAPPVAVLTSRLTSGAGEAVVVASRGRDKTKTFGEPTAGIAAVTTSQTLDDGALITITTAWMADRTGKTYEDRIAPDETVAVDWTKIGTADDATLNAALAWLKTQPGCVK
jgi:C-terminal processing protease CtpA/Prc